MAALLAVVVVLVIVNFLNSIKRAWDLSEMASHAKSIVVSIHVLDLRECHALFGNEKDDVLSKVKQQTVGISEREFAGADWITVFLRDSSGDVFGRISIFRSQSMKTDTQMKSIISAATVGELAEKPVVPVGQNFRWEAIRKCTK